MGFNIWDIKSKQLLKYITNNYYGANFCDVLCLFSPNICIPHSNTHKSIYKSRGSAGGNLGCQAPVGKRRFPVCKPFFSENA